MIKAQKSDKKLIGGLLASSFAENPSINHIIAGTRRRQQRITRLMNYSFENCMRFGEVWLSDDSNGCALIMFPQNKRSDIASLWLDVKLAVTAIGISQVKKVMRRERLVAGKQPKGNAAYLLFIGVKPCCQKTGVGTMLLTEVLHRMTALDLPVYLETSVPQNLRWYIRLGFTVYYQVDIGYRLIFLIRNL